jgi:hypothetical protein
MNFTALVKRINRTPVNIVRLLEKYGIANTKNFNDTVYTDEQVKLLQWEVNKKKPELLAELRNILIEYPFSTEQEVGKYFGRPTSYTRWLISELTFDEQAELAETDDNRLFLLSSLTDEQYEKMAKEPLDINSKV